MEEDREFGLTPGEDHNPEVHPVGGEILVKQSEAGETDINFIVKRHKELGVPIFPDARASYGDFSGFTDYHEALNRLMEAQDEFMMLPPDVRDACQNDVGRFLEMIETEEGRKALGLLGLDESAIPEPVAVAEAEPAAEEGTVEST